MGLLELASTSDNKESKCPPEEQQATKERGRVMVVALQHLITAVSMLPAPDDYIQSQQWDLPGLCIRLRKYIQEVSDGTTWLTLDGVMTENIDFADFCASLTSWRM